MFVDGFRDPLPFQRRTSITLIVRFVVGNMCLIGSYTNLAFLDSGHGRSIYTGLPRLNGTEWTSKRSWDRCTLQTAHVIGREGSVTASANALQNMSSIQGSCAYGRDIDHLRRLAIWWYLAGSDTDHISDDIPCFEV